MYTLRLMSLTRSGKLERTEQHENLEEVRAAVEGHAAAGGFTKVKAHEDDDDGWHGLRYSATTPAGRAGRNIAYADIADDATEGGQ